MALHALGGLAGSWRTLLSAASGGYRRHQKCDSASRCVGYLGLFEEHFCQISCRSDFEERLFNTHIAQELELTRRTSHGVGSVPVPDPEILSPIE